MPNRIVLFNHKGGTGKTVSAYNIGWKLTEHGHKVLLVDGDSQVNLTALAMGFDRFDKYYEEGSGTEKFNIKDGVAPVFEGRPQPLEAFDCPLAQNNKSLHILPGHSDLSNYEGQLSLAQEAPGSLKVLNSLPGTLHSLMELLEEHHGIDYTIIDLNPGLGAINQNFIMACDGIIVPTNPDPFSLMAVKSLGTHLAKWHSWKETHFDKYEDATYSLYPSQPVFLGNLNARFNIHAKQAARKFDERIKKIDECVSEVLVPALDQAGMALPDKCYKAAYKEWKNKLSSDNASKYALARIPDFQSLMHVAIQSERPVFNLDEDCLSDQKIMGNIATNLIKNVSKFNLIFEAIASKIERLMGDDCRQAQF